MYNTSDFFLSPKSESSSPLFSLPVVTVKHADPVDLLAREDFFSDMGRVEVVVRGSVTTSLEMVGAVSEGCSLDSSLIRYSLMSASSFYPSHCSRVTT